MNHIVLLKLTFEAQESYNIDKLFLFPIPGSHFVLFKGNWFRKWNVPGPYGKRAWYSLTFAHRALVLSLNMFGVWLQTPWCLVFLSKKKSEAVIGLIMAQPTQVSARSPARSVSFLIWSQCPCVRCKCHHWSPCTRCPMNHLLSLKYSQLQTPRELFRCFPTHVISKGT